MIFADKLIQLRKRNGWSQEELAEQMNVTRQSVSKWEGAQSIPDLEKVIRLSELFGVSTDYLLKDSIEGMEGASQNEERLSVRRVSMEEASEFLKIKEETARSIAYGVFLCIISPICLLIMGALSELTEYNISENAAGGIGMVVLLILVASAVAIFIAAGNRTSAFEYLDKELFETEYGVSGMVRERKERYNHIYAKRNIIGVCLCILSLVPLFIGIIISDTNILLLVFMLCLMLVVAGIGVIFCVRSGIVWASYSKLLQEGDYTRQKKENEGLRRSVAIAYWLIAAAAYLAYSLATDQWDYSWIVWVVAGVLYPAVMAILQAFEKRK